METYPPSKRYDLKFKADICGIEELTVPSNYSYCFQCKKKECREKGCAKDFVQLEEGHEQPYTGEDGIAKRSVTILRFHFMGFEPLGFVFQND
nr:hypothetical protein CFP56_42885 [Quercus suber]